MANIGIACGNISGGLLVVDADGDEGQSSLKEVEKIDRLIPRTSHALTGTGGHFYLYSSVAVKN